MFVVCRWMLMQSESFLEELPVVLLLLLRTAHSA
jgi:hypothetical protein